MDALAQPIANRAENVEQTVQTVVDMAANVINPFIADQVWNTVDVWPIPADPQHVRLNGRQVEVRLVMGSNLRPEMRFPAHNHRYMFEVQTTPGAPDIWRPYRVLHASPRRQLLNDQNVPLALHPEPDGRVVLGLIDTPTADWCRTAITETLHTAVDVKLQCAAGVQECQQLAALNANYDEEMIALAVETMAIFTASDGQMDNIIEELEMVTVGLDTAAVVDVPPATPPPPPPPAPGAGVPFLWQPGVPNVFFDQEPAQWGVNVPDDDPNAGVPQEFHLPGEQPQPNPLLDPPIFLAGPLWFGPPPQGPGGGPPRHPPPGGFHRFP